MSANGSPLTSKRSAKAPGSITPILPGYGLRGSDKASASALVLVAMCVA